MKKREIVLVFSVLIVLLITFSLAENITNSTNITVQNTSINNTATISNSTNTQARIDNGYACLQNFVKSDCSGISKISDLSLTILASPSDAIVTKCVEKLESLKKTNCFGDASCNVKDTAMAILALNHVRKDTKLYQDWLKNQTRTATDLIWYLQQDSEAAADCRISYDANDYDFKVQTNKKIDVNAGPCLSLARSNYWFLVSPSCYDKEFTITCNQNYVANFLYSPLSSEVIYVLSETKSSTATNPLTLKIKSTCFGTTTCDYEGSAWAAYALDMTGNEIKDYLPYLIATEDANKQYLPAAFLNMLLDYTEYGTKLIQQQNLNYWEAENSAYNKYYDTALALLSLGESNQQQVLNAKGWLMNLAQDSSTGCWNNNVRDTAMALWAYERRQGAVIGNIDTTLTSCAEGNGFCLNSKSSCSGENAVLLNNYFCAGGKYCCSEDLKLCSEYEGGIGKVCASDEQCSGVEIEARDGACCTSECEPIPEQMENTCEEISGQVCRTSCSDVQQEVFGETCESADLVCCKPKAQEEGGSLWWLWLLLILLIILLILAYIFRDRIKVYITKKKTGFKEDNSSSSGSGNLPPRGPPGRPMMMQRPMARPMPFGNRPGNLPPLQARPQNPQMPNKNPQMR